MSSLVWDEVGSRQYETGLDRGVLYLSDGSAVPWNGLTSVVEAFDREISPIYYDGMKINDIVSLGSFSGTMKAVTYPDEFMELEGLVSIKKGAFVSDQKPKTFGLCYRTQIGNDLDGASIGYKIHVLYNVTAIPVNKTYETMNASPTINEFEWNISAIPEEVPGLHPTAHFIFSSIDLAPGLLAALEKILYGDLTSPPSLIPMLDLVTYIKNWYTLQIIANGDGTWTAVSQEDGYIQLLPGDLFQIDNANAVYLDDYTYVITDVD